MCSKDILIVEDDNVILRILELELKYEGYTFDVAQDGREGLELFEKNNYNIILLDIMLPSINGLELCRKIRIQSNVHIIMLTAKRDVTDRVIGLDTGADDYITKPFEIEELLARIRSVLRRINMGNEKLMTIQINYYSTNWY